MRDRSPRRNYDRKDSYGYSYDNYRECPGPKPYSDQLRLVRWPENFKAPDVKPYDGRTDPEQWLNVYETTIRTTRGDEHVMANYLPVLLGRAATH